MTNISHIITLKYVFQYLWDSFIISNQLGLTSMRKTGTDTNTKCSIVRLASTIPSLLLFYLKCVFIHTIQNKVQCNICNHCHCDYLSYFTLSIDRMDV